MDFIGTFKDYLVILAGVYTGNSAFFSDDNRVFASIVGAPLHNNDDFPKASARGRRGSSS